MAVTLELVAPSELTLTASLFPQGSDTAAVSIVTLTERSTSKGVYRGTFTAGPAGQHRVAESGVTIQVKLYSGSQDTGAAYDGATMTATSGADGIASLQLPRNAALRFKCRRGTGPWIAFSGVDAETLELPLLIG